MIELKPCPICNAKVIWQMYDMDFGMSFWHPKNGCILQFLSKSFSNIKDIDEYTEAWNTRPGETSAFEDGYQQALTNHQIMNENESEKFLKKIESNKKVGPIPTPGLEDVIRAYREKHDEQL